MLHQLPFGFVFLRPLRSCEKLATAFVPTNFLVIGDLDPHVGLVFDITLGPTEAEIFQLNIYVHQETNAQTGDFVSNGA